MTTTSDEQSSQHEKPASNEDTFISLTDQLEKAEALLSGDHSDTTNNTNNNSTNNDASSPPNSQEQMHPPSVRAITILNRIQDQIQRSSLFSTNESLDDVQTSSLVLIATEYHLGKAHLQLPTTPPSANGQNTYSSSRREKNVLKAVEYFYLFLERCDVLEGLLEDTITNDYRSVLLAQQNDYDDNSNHHSNNDSPTPTQRITPTPPTLQSSNRDAKIARYRQTQTLKSQTAHLNALISQRRRLQLPSHEHLDGHDEETLSRSLVTSNLNLHALDSLEEIQNCQRELEMLSMAVRMERQRQTEARHTGLGNPGDGAGMDGTARHDARIRQERPRQPLNLTHVTQDRNTGQLIFRKEQVRSTVFQPSWNQPTMTLEELARKEVADAKVRSEKQAEAEAEARLAPRRYEQLVRDGMEDDAELVEASAVLDRKWDDWKDANPRGSGNKMGDVGDRNI